VPAETKGILRKSHVPLFIQIEEDLRGLIGDGQLGELDQVPSESELTQRFGVSRMTVRRALDRLVSDGVLFRKPGKGTFVAPAKILHQPSQGVSFSGAMREHGFSTSTIVLSAAMTPAPYHVVQALRVPVGDSVTFVRRLRLVEGLPVAVHQSYLPGSLASVLSHDLSGSLTELLEQLGAKVATVEDTLEAVRADLENAHLLHVGEGTPLIHITGTAYGQDLRPIRYSEAYYRGDRFKFRVHEDLKGIVPFLQPVTEDAALALP
jgi:GntR family transcriptional regulator